MNTIDAGKYRHKINIYRVTVTKDADDFPIETRQLVMSPYAEVKTTRGMTLIRNETDFEKAYTRFTIRYPRTPIDRDMIIVFRNKKVYTIEYLNNVDEASVELEIQAKEITH